MENRIVQLNEYEYNKLNEKATLNDSQIKELAEKYYRERGIFRIDITQQLKGFDDCYRSYDVYSFCTENGRYKESDCALIEEDINEIKQNIEYDSYFDTNGYKLDETIIGLEIIGNVTDNPDYF